MLDGPGFESLPIPVDERFKARVCDRLLAEIVGSNPAGAWMFVLCVLYSTDKRQKLGKSGKRSSTDEVQKKKSR